MTTPTQNSMLETHGPLLRDYLLAGNSIEDLADLYLSQLSVPELIDLVREAQEYAQ